MGTRENPLTTFDADAIAWLEARMWEAYYAKQDARLFVLLVRLVAQQFGLPWARATDRPDAHPTGDAFRPQ